MSKVSDIGSFYVPKEVYTSHSKDGSESVLLGLSRFDQYLKSKICGDNYSYKFRIFGRGYRDYHLKFIDQLK